MATVFTRILIGFSPFSGKFNAIPVDSTEAPYGDFECHRSWQAQTYFYPPSLWYTNTTLSNNSYWPIDYPPLCSYFHRLMATTTTYHLGDLPLTTPGYMEEEYVSYMRFWVIVSEYLIFVPSCIFLVHSLDHVENSKLFFNSNHLGAVFTILMQPAMLIIDHGHFQFNQVMHGFVLLAIAFMLRG